MGMNSEPALVSEPIDIYKLTKQKSTTTENMKKQRSVVDNKDIRSKTIEGQLKTKEENAKRDANERVRVPETSDGDSDNVGPD